MKFFSDLSDLVGVEKTEDIQYLKILRKSMWVIGAWPRRPYESLTSRRIPFLTMVAFVLPGVVYLKVNTGKLSYLEIGHSYITVIMNIPAISRGLMIAGPKYNQFLYYFLNEMHLFNYRKKSVYSYKTHTLVHKISHFFTTYLLTIMYFGIALFNLTPMYNNYTMGMYKHERPENATFDHAVFYSLPFDCLTDPKGYIALNIFNCYISTICASYFCVVDLIISLCVFHLWGHMRILKYNLDSIPKPASLLVESEEYEDGESKKDHNYTKQELREVHARLRENIHYHSVIIDFQSKMSDVFGEVLLFYLLFHQVSECLLMFECSQMDKQALMRYGPLTVVTFQQLIQLSIIFELLGSSNDKLIDSVYSLPWEYMDIPNRKLVIVMMMQVQRSMNLKAMSMLTVGVQNMTSIIRTSFSYFVMLRTVAEEE